MLPGFIEMRAQLYYRKISSDTFLQLTEVKKIEWSEVVDGGKVPTPTQLKLLKLFEGSLARFNGIVGVLERVTWEYERSQARVAFEWAEGGSVSLYRGPLYGWKVFLPQK